jgi:hypothetical protein
LQAVHNWPAFRTLHVYEIDGSSSFHHKQYNIFGKEKLPGRLSGNKGWKELIGWRLPLILSFAERNAAEHTFITPLNAPANIAFRFPNLNLGNVPITTFFYPLP